MENILYLRNEMILDAAAFSSRVILVTPSLEMHLHHFIGVVLSLIYFIFVVLVFIIVIIVIIIIIAREIQHVYSLQQQLKIVLSSTLIYRVDLSGDLLMRARAKNKNQKGKSLNLFRDLIDANVQSELSRVSLIALITQCDSMQ